MPDILCKVCGRRCRLAEEQTGPCRARQNRNGQNVCANYGRITSIAMDPIEKKPLARFFPGSRILSVGSYGCSYACPFCQNSVLSMGNERTVPYRIMTPSELTDLAHSQEGNLGIAFTYNEPLISYEYIMDTAELARPLGLKIVVVSNGSAEPEILARLAPVVDAWNIDLKGDAAFYRTLGGRRETVCRALEYLIPRSHVEVTTLIVPGHTDRDAYIEEEAAWLAAIDPDTVLHITRYFPRYHYTVPAPSPALILHLQAVASKYLNDVRTGNI